MNIIKYIGLPYLSKGRSIEGLDCWGLVKLFYKEELDIIIPSYISEYKTAEHKNSVSEAILLNIPNWQKINVLRLGDVLVFNILGFPTHTGIYIGNNDFLHSFKNTNSCIERLNSLTWNRRLFGGYRWVKT